MTRYLSLAEFWYLAEHVTGIETATLIQASRVDLADSALHAPRAGFEDTDFSPDVVDKAAVLAAVDPTLEHAGPRPPVGIR